MDYYDTKAGIMARIATHTLYATRCRETAEQTGRASALHQAMHHEATIERLKAQLVTAPEV